MRYREACDRTPPKIKSGIARGSAVTAINVNTKNQIRLGVLRQRKEIEYITKMKIIGTKNFAINFNTE
jgi:hypothetical protein